MKCPRCGSENVNVQQIQTGSIGAGTNKVVIEQPRRSKGCLYWLLIGWWAWVIKLFSYRLSFCLVAAKRPESMSMPIRYLTKPLPPVKIVGILGMYNMEE